MFITRWMDYGVRIMMGLGAGPDGRQTADDLAKQAGISRSSALKIVHLLAEAGLVDAKRGVKGGVVLARRSDEITMMEVLDATERPRALNSCLLQPKDCVRSDDCAFHRFLKPVQDHLDKSLRETTLGTLVKMQAEG